MWHLTVPQHPRLGGDTDECADRVEHVDEEEREHDDEHVDREDVCEVKLEGDRSDGRRQASYTAKRGQAHRQADERRAENAEQ